MIKNYIYVINCVISCVMWMQAKSVCTVACLDVDRDGLYGCRFLPLGMPLEYITTHHVLCRFLVHCN